jgi:hypothetical protein
VKSECRIAVTDEGQLRVRTGQSHFYLFGGEGEIRTRERVVPSPVSPALYTCTVSANASGAVATLVSAGTHPRLRRVGVGLPGVLSPSRAKRPDTYSGPASSASRCSDRGIVQAHDNVSRSPVSVRHVCARI